jgi:hypothetical protein
VFKRFSVCDLCRQFQHGWNVSCTSKNYQFQYAVIECVVVIIVSYNSMSGICCDQKIQCV